MSVGLLDVNVLIALAWPSHVHHGAAHAWFSSNHAAGWATCPITQSAFVRVSSNPMIIEDAVSPKEALVLLTHITSLNGHVFWADELPLDDVKIPTDLLVGHRQVTDAYLLGLSIYRGGKLVTFDRRISALLPADESLAGVVELVPSKTGS